MSTDQPSPSPSQNDTASSKPTYHSPQPQTSSSPPLPSEPTAQQQQPSSSPSSSPPNNNNKHKIRPLIISMGGQRQTSLIEMFSTPPLSTHFHPPEFTPGIPSRSIRNRIGLITAANSAGLLPTEEWNSFEQHKDNMTEDFAKCFDGVEVVAGRKGSKEDVEKHYCVEFWRKAKGLSRGRAVLGCTLAHLIAMRKCVEEGFDIILEDNVRSVMSNNDNGLEEKDSCECARRILETIDASSSSRNTNSSEEEDEDIDHKCHLRYFGWLGSLKHLNWVIHTHAQNTATPTPPSSLNSSTTFPFPSPADAAPAASTTTTTTDDGNTNPGGTPIWGLYAYWISREGLEAVLSTLRTDVGAIMWKGKRMRAHVAKPVDKIVPRALISRGMNVQVTTHPVFFRAPMLTSRIHTQWDPEFCKSTEYQLEHSGNDRTLNWNHLWLTPDEKEIVDWKQQTGDWVTMAELAKLKEEKKEPSPNIVNGIQHLVIGGEGSMKQV